MVSSGCRNAALQEHSQRCCTPRRLYPEKQPGGPVADLYINQLVSSSLTWPEQGLTINQTATLNGPNNTALTKISFTTATETGMIVVQLRIPSWVAEGASQV